MTDQQWEIAHDIAFELVDRGTDPNELGKVLAFLRQHRKDSNVKSRMMTLLRRMAGSRTALIRSRQTQRYYQNLQEACQSHLRAVDDPEELLKILGWGLRLMRYYRVEPKRAVEDQQESVADKAKRKPAPRSSVQQSVQKRAPKPEEPAALVRVGEKVSALIQCKEGSKVTVKLQASYGEEVTFEQPYYPGQVGARVKVRIQAIDNDGKVTKVIPG